MALLVWFLLAGTAMREVGVVGEVAQGWGMGRPAAVLVQVDPPLWADGAASPTAGDRDGSLVASQARPIEGLRLGPLALPLAINTYTGGPPDWPARATYLLTGSLLAVRALNMALGGLLIALVYRFLRFHGTHLAAGIAALVLATDAGFLFYRAALGGTELLLQAAGLLCLWAFWSRRWAGGRHGVVAFAVGVGLGLLAKATFALTLAALLGAALLTRWDKPALRPPLPPRIWTALVPVVALTAPLWVTWIHHALAVPAVPHIASHDFPGVQLGRLRALLGEGQAPAREQWANLSYWAGNPLAFLGPAYGARAPAAWSPWRVVAWAVLLAGVALAWRARHPSPVEALLRFTSVYLLLQVGLLLLFARDLHHLGQAAPTLAILAGLALERLAGATAPVRSFARARTALLLALPWLATGVAASWGADAALATIPTPTFTTSGQRALVAMLRGAGVRRLVACDYELTGLLELEAPEIAVVHGWGAASQATAPGSRQTVLTGLLRLARGGHFLVVKPSAPMIYNLTPGTPQLTHLAEAAGLRVTELAALPQGGATLYAVE